MEIFNWQKKIHLCQMVMLADRTLVLEGNLQAFQIISKDKRYDWWIKLNPLESYVNDENKKLSDLMKSLESFSFQEVQTLQKAVTNRFRCLEELAKTDKKSIVARTKEIRGDLTLPVSHRVRDDLWLVTSPDIIYPVTFLKRQQILTIQKDIQSVNGSIYIWKI